MDANDTCTSVHRSGPLTVGYYLGAAVMFAGGLIAWFFGVNAERKSFEDIATPLSAVVWALGETG